MVFGYLLKHHPPGASWARMIGAGGLEPDPPRGLGTSSPPVLRLLQTPPRGNPTLWDWKLLQVVFQSCWPSRCGNYAVTPPPRSFSCSPGIHTPVSKNRAGRLGSSPWEGGWLQTQGGAPRLGKASGQETQEEEIHTEKKYKSTGHPNPKIVSGFFFPPILNLKYIWLSGN